MYPSLANLPDDEPQFPKNNVVVDNLHHDAPMVFGKDGLHERFVQLGRVENNPETVHSPGSFDANQERFTFDASSRVFERLPALRSIPVDRIGRNRR